jgi:phosphohistidine phosphatase
MIKLVVMRHAKAVREYEAPTDRARGLTERGRLNARAAAAALVRVDLHPTRALVSDAARTRETWAELAPAFSAAEVVYLPAPYLAPPEMIWDEIAPLLREEAGKTILALGHAPGVHELIRHLGHDSADRSNACAQAMEDMPTSSWAAFELRGETYAAPGARFLAAWRP